MIDNSHDCSVFLTIPDIVQARVRRSAEGPLAELHFVGFSVGKAKETPFSMHFWKNSIILCEVKTTMRIIIEYPTT